jgi:hypothetical protein
MKTRGRARIAAAVIAMVAFLPPIGARAQTQPDAKLQTLTPEPVEPTGLNPAVGAFDVIVVRPLAAAALPVGVAFFVPAALLSAPGGREPVGQALEFFVLGPARYVFTRPLGEF